MAPAKPHKPYPRVEFDYDKIPAKPAVEPPLPTSEAARNHAPNPYVNSQLTHEKIAAIRAKSTIPAKDTLNVDYAQDAGLYPEAFPHFVRGRDSLREYITSLFTSQIAIYDGAMGTMIQNYSKRNKLEEEEYRGDKFKDWSCNVKGNNDMLSITQPHVIQGIYRQYLEEGGSNLIGTNTFSSTTIAMADYEMEDYAYELNYEGARLAREVCDEVTAKDPTKPRFVVGAIGPTNRTGSISPSVEDPSARNVTFDELVDTYFEQIVGLMDGGADILMVETIFDTLNAKAALYAGFRLLMDKINIREVDRVVLAGAFGTHIDPKYAMVLGMIPDCLLANVRAAGNSAGAGARMALLNQAARRDIEAVVRQIEKIETAVEASFQDHFVKAMAIPHKSDPYANLAAAVDLPVRILTDEDAPALASGRRRGGRRR